MIREDIIVGEGMRFPVKGMLTIPEGVDGPVPAVVLVHGSGSSNMDEAVGKVTPFKDLAEGLAEHGIASIRYNKRAHEHSYEMRKAKGLPPVTVKEETIYDAIYATDILRKDKRIDSKRIYVIGHSLGGMLAPRIDAEGGKFAGIIIMSGSPRKIEELIIEQNMKMVEYMSPVSRFLAKSQINNLKKDFETMFTVTDKEAKKRKMTGGVTLYYYKEMNRHSTVEYLHKLRKPMLIMHGEKDFQLDVEKDFEAYKTHLKLNPNVTYKLYENLNHVFVPSVYGTINKMAQEYSVEQHIGEDVIADIANWIKEVK